MQEKAIFRGFIRAYSDEMLVSEESIYNDNSTQADLRIYDAVVRWARRSGKGGEVMLVVSVGDTEIKTKTPISGIIPWAKAFINSALIEWTIISPTIRTNE